jgi:hypothetical protein
MEIGEDIVQYPYEFFKNISISAKHPLDPYFQELIKKYTCFQEKSDHKFSKWNQRTHISTKQVSKRTERPKIGNLDNSIENTLRKEFQTILNKLTESNLDNMVRKTRMSFNKDYMFIYTDTLYDYFKKQPNFQKLYISILETIYQLLQDDDILTMNSLWSKEWNTYNVEKKWILTETLVEQSEDYDIFCEYQKEKKINISLAQAWGRLLALGSLNIDPYEWLLEMVEYCNTLDLTNKSYQISFDCYIDQMKEFYKVLPKCLQNNMSSSYLYKLYHLKDLDLPKIGYFKLIEFIELLEKNENVCKIHHQLLEDGL